MKLRPYQQQIVSDLEEHFAFDKTAVVTLAGGGGKSAIIAEVARAGAEAKQHVVVLTNLSALIGQLARHLDEFGIKYNIVKAGIHKTEPNAYVSLIMEQSYHEAKRAELDIQCNILCKDEFQIGSGQKRYEDIVKHLNPDNIAGFTFTPIDEKGYLLKGLKPDNLVNVISVDELTEQGYLVPIKYYIPKFSEQVDYSGVASSGNDYNGVEIDNIVNTDSHTKLSIDSMNQLKAKDKKTLVYCASIDHAEKMKIALDSNGYKTAIVHSKMPKKHNEDAISRFKDENMMEGFFEQEEVDCLLSVMSLGIGFDAPNANLLVMMRATKVKRLALQIFARISRTFADKEYGEILDLAQSVRNNGFLNEPIEIIEYGNKKELVKAEQKNEVIEHIVNEEPTEVTRELILEKIKEIENEAKDIPSLSVENLSALFNMTSDIHTAAQIAFELNYRIKGIPYKENTVEWAVGPMNNMIDEFPDYHARLTKTFKTRMKSIVRDGKKLAGIYYFPDWLKKQVPYNLGDDDFDIA